MNRKQILAILTFAVIATGVIISMTPFMGSLRPGARADAALPRYSLIGLSVGQMSILEGPSLGEIFNSYELKLLAYKSTEGKINVWKVPVKNGRVGMPDLHWWKPIYDCAQLKVLKGPSESVITCTDENVPKGWAEDWRWDLSGVNLGKMVDDLESAKGVVENGYFVFAKSR
jgi:hypothetical protein